MKIMKAGRGESMKSVERSPFFRTEDLLRAPSVQRTAESVEQLLPGACVWFRPAGHERIPLAEGGKTHCEEFSRLSADEQRRVSSADLVPGETQREDIPLVRECCPGRFRALVPLRFGATDLGVVGVCGLGDEQAKHAARIVSGMLRLVINLLEDHDDLELIHRVWDEMGSASEVKPFLLGCLDRVLTAVGVNVGAIFLFDEEGRARFHQQRGLDVEKAGEVPLEFTLPEFERLIEGRRETSIPVPEDSPLRTWAEAVIPEGESQSHFYVLPFSHREQIEGFCLLLPPRSFSGEKERPALHVLLDGMGSTIHNVLALRGERSRSQALSVIHAIHRVVSMSETKEDFLPRLCQLVADTFHAEKCSIMLWNAESRRLEPAAWVGLEEGEIGTRPVGLNEGLIGKAAATYEAGQLVRSRGMTDTGIPESHEYRVRSYLSVPLVGDDLVAVMTLGSDEREFSAADRHMAFTLGEQIVIALRLLEVSRGGGAVTPGFSPG